LLQHLTEAVAASSMTITSVDTLWVRKSQTKIDFCYL
jgi:hypothetical protein